MNEPRMVNIIVLQNMLQKCFNMSQLPSPNEGLVLTLTGTGIPVLLRFLAK